MGGAHSDLLIPEDEEMPKTRFSQPTTCRFVDPDTDLCTARLWERCFTLKGLQILTETFRLHELMTHEVASLVVAPLTANASTNFVNAFVDGTLDTDWMPEGTLKQMSYHEVDELVDKLGAEVGSVNVFVSHAWNTKWSTLMKMLERLDHQLRVEGTVTVGDPSNASHPAYMRAKGRESERDAEKAAGFLASRLLNKKMSKKDEEEDAPAASTATEQEAQTDTGPGPVTESFDPEAAVAAAYRGHRPGPVAESAGTSGAGAGRNVANNRDIGGGAAAAAAAVAATNLGPGMGAFEGRRIHYFVDVFAVRQLYSTEKYGVHTHQDVPDMQFPFVVRKAQIFALACYPWFEPVALTRSWCMNELAYAIQYGKPVEIMFGERFYDIAEAKGENRMAASIERIKNSQRLKDFIKEFKLEDCGCSNNREKLHLDTETWKLLTGGDEHYTANGPLRRALLGPLGRMKVLEIDEATMHSEYPDSPRIDTPPQEMSDEEEEEQLQHSSHFNAHSMLGITSGKLGAAMKSISMGDDSTDISEEALMPRVVRLRPLPERFWDKSKLALEGHMGSVWCCTFSPDGRYVASGGTGGLIKIWVAKTGLEKCTLVGHRGAVLCLEWSQYTADDLTCYGRIISGGEDKTLKIWDTSTGLLIATCHGHIGGVNTVCIDPCRMSYIVSGGRGKLIKVWSINGGSAMQSLVGHNDMIMCLAISPNAEWIVSGSVDRTAKVWDVDHLYTPQQKMVLRTTLYNHTSAVWCTAVSATGKYFVTGSSDETIKIWSSFHCVLHANLKMGASVYSMRISFDGRTLVATLKDRSLRIYDLSDAEAVRKGKPKKVFACSKHWTWGTPDGLPPPGALVFAGQDRPQQEQRTTYVEEGKGEVTMWACDISPDGTRVVTSGDDTRLKIWDTSKIIGFKRMSSNGG